MLSSPAVPGGADVEQRKEWEEIQGRMSVEVKEKDTIDFSSVRYVGGVDLSFLKGSNDVACAALVVLELPR